MEIFQKQLLKFFDKATLSTWLNFSSKLIILAFVTPLVITKFSTAEIAFWYLFISIQSLAHLFDLGFSSTIIRFTAYSLSKRTAWLAEIKELYQVMNLIFFVLSLLVLIFLIIIGFVSVNPLVNKNLIYNGNAAWIFVCLLFPINFYFKKNDSFLKGLNKITLVNNWNAMFYFIYGVGSLIILFSGNSFYILIIWSQVYALFNSIKNFFLLKKIVPGLKLIQWRFTKNTLLEYWSPTWKSSLISLSSQGSVHITSLIITSFLPINLSASYLFTVRLIQMINEFSWAPFYSQIPGFIQEYKKGNLIKIRGIVLDRLQISILILVFGGTLLVLVGPIVLKMFESNVDLLNFKIAGLILIAIVIERTMATHSQIIMFTNDLRHYKLYLLLALIYLTGIQLLRTFPDLLIVPLSYYIASLYAVIVIIKRAVKILNFRTLAYIGRMKFVYISLLIILMITLLH